jgi:hypothetical protein
MVVNMLGAKRKIVDPFRSTTGSGQMGGNYGVTQMGGFDGTQKQMGDAHASSAESLGRSWGRAGTSNRAPSHDGSSSQMGGFPYTSQQMG